MTGLLSSKEYTSMPECPYCGLFHKAKSYINESSAKSLAERQIETCRKKRELQGLEPEKPHLLAGSEAQ